MPNPEIGRILVTGGTGFIGRYVVGRLIAEGIRPVVTTFKKTQQENSQIDVEVLDLTDASQVNNLINNYNPQIVLHLAGVTPGHSDPTGRIYHDVNFTGTVNLLNALKGTSASRVILLGSASEYGNQAIPFTEAMPLRPVSDYAVSKVEANRYAVEMNLASGLPVTILRVFTAYGFDQPDKMFLSQLLNHALLNRNFKMSDGEQKRDFVHVDDVSSAILVAMTAENVIGRVINLAGGRGIALKDIARHVWKICKADPELLEIGALEKARDDCFNTEADISLAAEILNWHPGAPILSESGASPKLIETIRLMRNALASAAK